MLSWFIAAALILIFELFVGTIYLLVVSAALFGAGLAALLFDSPAISVITAAILAAIGIWWAKGWIRRHRRAPEVEAARSDLDIGQTVQIVRHLHTDQYEVLYRGAQWQAQAVNHISAPHPAPATGVITGKQGNLLLIHLH
ncbi:NfeD family protein [Uruburuella testudinis]|uniref:NfeD family protein n=1 Tax=Uruburuella testudinis TaxID=1282863 RepID=A0ABY4DYF6_9NEIS|nr:NfeD family protein [Uruburuella testudinis]UOO83094.1 NfeD family protein [Uruburuella testudinis]